MFIGIDVRGWIDFILDWIKNDNFCGEIIKSCIFFLWYLIDVI